MARRVLPMFRQAAALLIAFLPIATPALGDQTDAGDAGAVYEYLRWHYAITPGGYSATNSVRVTILAERGQEYAQLSFFENSYHKLKSVNIRVYDASGKLAYERRKGDLEKFCGYAQTAFYSDDCHYFGTFQLPAYPYSIEYQWAVESKSLFFLRGCDFQRSAPVKEAVYTLETAGAVQFDYQTYGLAEGIEPQISPDGRTYTWLVTDLPALSDLEMLPPGCPEPSGLAVTPGSIVLDGYYFDGSSWNAVGRSLAQLCEDRFLPFTGVPPAPTGQASAEAAKACYDSVRDEIRYVAIEVGLGGWRPHPAALTQERRFGDCKDNSILLVSRLRNAGVPAWPVHVLTRDHGPVDPDFPSFDFNHVITLALVGDDSVWLIPPAASVPTASFRQTIGIFMCWPAAPTAAVSVAFLPPIPGSTCARDPRDCTWRRSVPEPVRGADRGRRLRPVPSIRSTPYGQGRNGPVHRKSAAGRE